MIRLDKYLADCGVGTRSEVKNLLKAGRVKNKDVTVKDGALKIDENNNEIYLDGNRVEYEKFHYFMLNKPAGCVSATKDKLSETVLGYLKGEVTKNLFPVGRLDKDTEGLLLITDDGQLAHNLLSPKKHVDKIYLARVTNELTKEQEEAFKNGLDIGDEKLTLPADIRKTGDHEYEVTIREGRFHQVKRMFEAVESEVVYLKRLSMGPLKLDESLHPGEYRKLTAKEICVFDTNC